MKSTHQIYFCELRDEHNDIISVGTVLNTAEAIEWFRERGIDFALVTMREPDHQTTSFEYTSYNPQSE